MAIPEGVTRLSELLVLGGGLSAEKLKIAVAAIDQVHGDGRVGIVQVTLVAGNAQQGSYVPGPPPAITIKSRGAEPALSLLHEVGHLLDDRGFGPGQGFRSMAGDIRLEPWRKAVSSSRLFARLASMKGKARMKVPRAFGPGFELASINQEVVEDWLLPRELFARSYAQYIAAESGDSTLTTELQHARSGRLYPEHWMDDDFVSIRSEMDALVRAQAHDGRKVRL